MVKKQVYGKEKRGRICIIKYVLYSLKYMAGIKWRVLNNSVRGVAHIRQDICCQDYSLCQTGEDNTAPIILTASDGHGGSRYVRSAQGAVFACETATDVISGYIGAVFAKTDVNIIKQLSETRIKLDIVKKWRQKVLSHIKSNPFTDKELSLLNISGSEAKDMLLSKQISGKEKLLSAYGATLICVIILNDIIICEQLGDGDILFFYKNKKTVCPIEKDMSLIANETTSICSINAPFYFRHSITYLYNEENIPNLIMLATDGYANSFASSDDYTKTAGDYYGLLKEEGIDFVSENIDKWLLETSKEGSGDDITVVLAYRE